MRLNSVLVSGRPPQVTWWQCGLKVCALLRSLGPVQPALCWHLEEGPLECLGTWWAASLRALRGAGWPLLPCCAVGAQEVPSEQLVLVWHPVCWPGWGSRAAGLQRCPSSLHGSPREDSLQQQEGAQVG